MEVHPEWWFRRHRDLHRVDYVSFWLSVFAAKSTRVPVLISSDATTTQSRDGSRWKKWIRPFILGRVYRAIDVLMAPSPAIEELALRLGMPKAHCRN